MKNYHNIESRKFSGHDYYVAYGGGHIWRVWRTTWKGWIASNQTTGASIKGRILDDISRKLSAI
jgi:hypothetical protein